MFIRECQLRQLLGTFIKTPQLIGTKTLCGDGAVLLQIHKRPIVYVRARMLWNDALPFAWLLAALIDLLFLFYLPHTFSYRTGWQP